MFVAKNNKNCRERRKKLGKREMQSLPALRATVQKEAWEQVPSLRPMSL